MNDQTYFTQYFINHAIIDNESGTTVSGTTTLSQEIMSQAAEQRNVTASSLITTEHSEVEGIAAELPNIIKPLLEGQTEWAVATAGNKFFYLGCNIYGSPLGSNVDEMNMSFITEWNQMKDTTDIAELTKQLNLLIAELKNRAKQDSDYKDISEVVIARDELKKANGPDMLKFLKKTTPWVLRVAKDIGVGFVITYLS